MEVSNAYITAVLVVCCIMAGTAAATVPKNIRVFSIDSRQPSRGGRPSDPVTVTVDMERSLNTVSSRFIGITIDDIEILVNWSTLNFNSRKVQNMARALSPCYFRLGGTYADTMTYDLGSGHDEMVRSIADVPAAINLTASQWDAVNRFSHKVGWEFIMDLNALKRNPDRSWNPENARQLLKYSADRNFTIAGFELGNEYDVYKQTFNITVTPQQLAKDMQSLRELLSQFPAYSTSFIIGPETATNAQFYFEGFLAAGGSKFVRAASFHQYYFEGAKSNLSDFTDIGQMNKLVDLLDEVLGLSRFVDPLLPVWLSETSSAWGGGTPNVSDRFAAGFLWLDKLGVCAAKGVQTVIRQAFYGGNYSLINENLDPNPDFWLTILYKQIVSGPVFNVTARSDVRVYAACANVQHYKLGSVAMYMLNPNPYPVTLDLPQFKGHPLLVYSLTAGDDQGLLSKYMSLNGKTLKLVDDKLPDFVPKSIYGDVAMEAHSFMFVVNQDSRTTICMEQSDHNLQG